LHLALLSVGVRPGDLVILPTMTFIASANAISHAGAMPWLFEVTEASWTLDPAAVSIALESQTERREDGLIHTPTGRRVSAMMPVHTLGIPADMDALVEVARRFDLRVVADAAAALGAHYKGRPVGQLGADLSVFSFNGNKTLTAGGGGAVVGHDEAACARAAHLSTTARIGREYDHDAVAFNYRMTNLQAAVGCAQLERLDDLVGAKQRIDARYREAFAEVDQLGTFPSPDWAQSACWLSGATATHRIDPRGVQRDARTWHQLSFLLEAGPSAEALCRGPVFRTRLQQPTLDPDHDPPLFEFVDRSGTADGGRCRDRVGVELTAPVRWFAPAWGSS
jgi:dTDP-4-amino-4,6-dideoxygalactose transaminase